MIVYTRTPIISTTTIILASVFVISTILLVGAPPFIMKYNNNQNYNSSSSYYSSLYSLFPKAYAQLEDDGGVPDYGSTDNSVPDYSNNGPADNGPTDYGTPDSSTADNSVPDYGSNSPVDNGQAGPSNGGSETINQPSIETAPTPYTPTPYNGGSESNSNTNPTTESSTSTGASSPLMASPGEETSNAATASPYSAPPPSAESSVINPAKETNPSTPLDTNPTSQATSVQSSDTSDLCGTDPLCETITVVAPNNNNDGNTDPLKQYLSPAESNPDAFNPKYTIEGGGTCGGDTSCTLLGQYLSTPQATTDTGTGTCDKDISCTLAAKYMGTQQVNTDDQQNNPSTWQILVDAIKQVPEMNEKTSEERTAIVASAFERAGYAPDQAQQQAAQYIGDWGSIGSFAGGFLGGLIGGAVIHGMGPELPSPTTEAPLTDKLPADIQGNTPSEVDPIPVVDDTPVTPDDANQYQKLKNDLAAQELQGAEPNAKLQNQDDPYHNAGTFTKDNAANGETFTIKSGDGTYVHLIQVPDEVNGQQGIQEWIVNSKGELTHQRFIPGGEITGYPNQDRAGAYQMFIEQQNK